MRIRFAICFAVLAGSLTLAQLTTAQETVRIAVSVRNVVLMPYYFASDKGFFDREGLRAELIQIRSNLQVAGVASGELDFMSGVGTAIDAMRKGAPLKVLGVLYRAPLFTLMSGPAMKAPRDLVGRKVGVSRIGSESHNAAVWMLSQNGAGCPQGHFHSNREHDRQHDRPAAKLARRRRAEPAIHG
jgi:ABC-type nitrate/sulfonate/bicarbonate transport system substrate-binding protein